jgi:holliday junction DNA helicase RuvB
LAASTGEDPVTIEDVYEPFLMQSGFLSKTPRGRILTRSGWAHLHAVPPIHYDRKFGGHAVVTEEAHQQLSITDAVDPHR